MINLLINIVIWAENRNKSEFLASSLTRGKLVSAYKDVYEVKIQFPDKENYLITLRGYFRWPLSYVRSIPEGITDILIVNLSLRDSLFYEDARNYINTRRGIPFKYITSLDNLKNLSEELECQFIPENEIFNHKVLKSLLKSVINLDYSLRQVFNKIDLDKNGQLKHEELFRISQENSFKMTEEEVKDIVFTLSKDGNISYEKFKKWFIMGKHDFSSFRRLVDIYFTLDNFILDSNNFFKKLKFEVDEISRTNLKYESKIEITSNEEDKIPHYQKDLITNEYTNININVVTGIEVDSLLDTLPDYLRFCPFSFGLELFLRSNVDGPIVIYALEQVRESMMNVSYIKEIFSYGVLFNFRHIDNKVFIDLSLNQNIFKDSIGKWDIFNFENVEIGNINFHFINELKIYDLMEITFNNFIDKICNFKVDYHGEFSNLKMFTGLISNLLKVYLNVNEKINSFNFLKILSNFTNINLDMKYNSKDLAKSLKEVLSDIQIKKIKSYEYIWNKSKEEMYNMGINSAEEQYNIFQSNLKLSEQKFRELIVKHIKPYIESLKLINFDKIHFFVLVPFIKVYIKLGLSISGLNKIIISKYFRNPN